MGYDNEASFSKAFKRLYGQSPGGFRSRQGLNDTSDEGSDKRRLHGGVALSLSRESQTVQPRGRRTCRTQGESPDD